MKDYTFGSALEALKNNKKVCRVGWNGKGMFLVLVKPDRDFVFNDGFGMIANNVQLNEYIAMKTADNKFVPWLASQTDMLAEDWMVVD